MRRSTVTGADTTLFEYDIFNNLKAVSLSDGTAISYLTDGLNRRVGKTVDGTLVAGYVYKDQLRIAAQTDGSGDVVQRYVYGDVGYTPSLIIEAGKTYRIVRDQLGSVQLVVDTDDGSIVQRLDYECPYGRHAHITAYVGLCQGGGFSSEG